MHAVPLLVQNPGYATASVNNNSILFAVFCVGNNNNNNSFIRSFYYSLLFTDIGNQRHGDGRGS